jgi:hypothetical protein
MKSLINNLQRCASCGYLKPLDEYYRLHRAHHGRASRCKWCLRMDDRWRMQRLRQQRPIRAMSTALSADEKAQAVVHGTLTCTKCHQERPSGEFLVGFALSISKRLRRECRACRVDRRQAFATQNPDRWRDVNRLKRCRRHGISLADFNALLSAQESRCAICGRHLGERGQAIDHDHASGVVRGLVHRHCNLALGNAREDPRILLGCLDYLRRHNPEKLLRFAFDVFVSTTPDGELPCANSA